MLPSGESNVVAFFLLVCFYTNYENTLCTKILKALGLE